MSSRPSVSVIFKCCLHHLIICRLTPLSTVISTQRSAYLVFPCRFATSIDTTSFLVLRSPRIRLSALIYPTSYRAQQISTSYASPNSLVLIFQRRFFYILSDILTYVQDFLVGQDHIYVYKDVVKQMGFIFELGSIFTSGLVTTIKKNKSWALASWNKLEMNKLLTPLLRHVRIDCIRKKFWEEALKTIN